MNNHLIIDFETMGQNVMTCPIVNCAYYAFDFDRFCSNPYTFKELISSIKQVKLNIEHQCNDYGYVIEPSSIDFWKSLPKEVRSQIKPSDEDVTLEQFYSEFIKYIKDKNIQYWWSRSNTFDPIILFTRVKELPASVETEMMKYLKFWKVRDIRTYIDAKFDFKLKFNAFVPIKDKDFWADNVLEHDSIHDLAADILRLQFITRTEQDLPIT